MDVKEMTVEKMEDLIICAMGDRKALRAICKALDDDTKKDVYAYIINKYRLMEGLKNGKED